MAAFRVINSMTGEPSLVFGDFDISDIQAEYGSFYEVEELEEETPEEQEELLEWEKERKDATENFKLYGEF